MDSQTFLTTVYVLADDFLKTQPPAPPHPGLSASLHPSEVVTLAVLGQCYRFPSERAFYRYANQHLRKAFPHLPHLSQLNRLVRQQRQAISAFCLYLAYLLDAQDSPYQVLDGMAVKVRDHRRRGRSWLAGQANIGYSNRLGWFYGFYLLVANTAEGVVSGFGLAPAATNDRRIAEDFLAARYCPQPALPWVGQAPSAPYLADKGFAGHEWQRHWAADYGAPVICLPKVSNLPNWSKPLRRQHSGWRQIAETVHSKLTWAFRLDRERPHVLEGLLARLAAMFALHNFCIWLNRQLGRPQLAFVDLLDW